MEKINEIGNQRDNEEISTFELFEQTQCLLEENRHFPLIEKARFLGTSMEEKYLFLYVVWKFLEGDRDPWIERSFKEIYDKFEIDLLSELLSDSFYKLMFSSNINEWWSLFLD